MWVLDFGGIGDGEAIVVSEGRALCGRWDVSIKEMLMAVWRKNIDGGGGVKLGTESRDICSNGKYDSRAAVGGTIQQLEAK